MFPSPPFFCFDINADSFPRPSSILSPFPPPFPPMRGESGLLFVPPKLSMASRLTLLPWSLGRVERLLRNTPGTLDVSCLAGVSPPKCLRISLYPCGRDFCFDTLPVQRFSRVRSAPLQSLCPVDASLLTCDVISPDSLPPSIRIGVKGSPYETSSRLPGPDHLSRSTSVVSSPQPLLSIFFPQ